MKMLFVLLFLVSCASHRKEPMKIGDCFVERGKDGGLHKVLSVHEHTYVTRPYGKYIKSNAFIPQVVPREDNLMQVECFEGKYLEDYMKELYKLRRDLHKSKT